MVAVFTTVVDDPDLHPIPGVKVSIKTDDGLLATLFDPNNFAMSLDNPVTSDAYGVVSFAAADDVYFGEYRFAGVLRRVDSIIVGVPPAFVGPSGPANATYLTLAALKASATSNGTALLTALGNQGLFIWTLGDYTGLADDVNIVKANSTALSVGAWVRQGAQSVLYNPTGVSSEAAIGNTDDGTTQGREYLSSFHKKLFNGSALKITTSGDSTTAGDFAEGFTPAYLINHYLRSAGYSNLLNVQNAGHSGDAASVWVNTYLAADLTPPLSDLYIIRWGMNGPTNQSALANAQAQLAQIELGLINIRTTRGLTYLDLPIILMPPNTAYDNPAYRTKAYFDFMSDGHRQLARKYQCAYFDTHRYLQDALVPAGGGGGAARGWINEDYGGSSGRYVHPTKYGNFVLIGGLCELLLSPGMQWNRQNLFWSQQFTGASLAYPTDLLDDPKFPGGISWLAVLSADGWPYQGVVETHKHASGYGWQYNYFAGANNVKVARRFYDNNSDAWSQWRYEVSSTHEQVDFAANLTVATGWTAGAGGLAPASALISEQVRAAGALVYASGGFADGKLLATLPASVRPSATRFVLAAHQQSGAYTGRCVLAVAADGTIKIYGATGIIAGDLVFLDGITVS